MTTPGQRAGYLDAMAAPVAPSGAIVMATFGPDGPERCSGQLVERTPGGATQQFTWVACRHT